MQLLCDENRVLYHKHMITENTDLTKLLKPYKKGWVALNQRQTQVLAHAATFTQITEKVKNKNPESVVLFPLGYTQTAFVGFQNG